MSLKNETPEKNAAANLRTGSPKFTCDILRQGEPLSNLIHKIGHEIGNPLTAIISVASVMQRFTQSGDSSLKEQELSSQRVGSYCGSILDEGWRINSLNERLVLILSAKAGNPEAVDVVEALKKSFNRIKSRFRQKFRGIDISIAAPEVPVYALVDAEQFQVVLIELLKNAYQGLTNNSEISESDELSLEPIKCTVQVVAGEAEIAIASTNSQPCPIELSELFEPFTNGYPMSKNLGLGLTVSLAVIERFQGSIQLQEFADSQGHTFRTIVRLPLGSPRKR